MVTAGREKLLFYRLYFLPLIRGLVCGMSICEVELDVGYVGLLRHLLFFVCRVLFSVYCFVSFFFSCSAVGNRWRQSGIRVDNQTGDT